MNHIVNQLLEIYQNHQDCEVSKLSVTDSIEYFIRLLASGNIIIYMDGDIVAGYIEFLRIEPHQLKKILDKDFYTFEENITDGQICYISDLFIHKNYRRSTAIKYLKRMCMKINGDCRYFVGHERKYKNRARIMENINGKR